MAQYLNPYEGIGNALINIGQNYDLDRRRKREAEEDQKRRRADYLWQSKQEEERANREYERDAPKREMETRIKLAELAKKQADAVTATLPRITNLTGAGGSYIDEFVKDDKGNITGVNRRHVKYTPIPREPKSIDWQKLYDEKGNVILVDPNDLNNRRETNLLGSPPRQEGMTKYQIQRMKADRLKAIEEINSEKDSDIARRLGVRASDPAGAAAIRNERARKLREVEDVYAIPEEASPTATTPAPRSFGTTAIDSIGQGLMKLGNAVTTTEDSVMADLAAGNITPQEAQAKLSSITGGRTRIDIPGVSIEAQPEAPAPKTKDQDITKTPEFKAEKAKLKKQYKDASDAEIEQYLLETWGK